MARFIESTKEINKAARKQRKPKQQKPKQQKPKQNASANKPASSKPAVTKTGGNKNKAGGSQYSVKQDRQITSRQTQAPKNNSVNRNTRENTNRATQRYSTNVRNGSQYSVANSANRRATRNYKERQNNRFESRKNELKDSNILKSTKTATNNDIRRMGGAQYKVDNSSRETEFGKKIADAERRAKLGLKGGTIEVLGSLANYIAENTDDKFGNRERDRYALQYATGQISEKELNQKYKELDDRWNSEKKTLQKAADDTTNLKLYGTALKEEGRKGLTGIEKTLYDGLSSIPYMAITRAAGPAWRLVTYMAGAGGDLADKKQMYENGEITDFERRKSSILSGGIETLTESAFGALTPLTNLPGAGAASKGLDDIILRGIDAATMNIRNGFLKNVAGSAMKLGAAGAEEAVEELAGSVLEVPAENISYRNRMDRDYRANLGSNTSALDEQIDYFISKGLTRDEAVRFVLESVNSKETLDAIVSDYVSAGLSEKNAKRQAKNLQEYMSAHLGGDKEAKQAAEDELAKGIKAEFSWKDANEAMAAAFAATVMTGAGTSAFSTFNGMNIKNQFEKVAGTKSAAETITEAAIKKGLDGSLASRAQAMNEHAKSGKDLSYEQYAELGNAILAQTVSNSKKANIAIKSAKEIADSESFYVMPGAVKSENGEYRFGQKSIVADEDGKPSIGINPGGVTENKAQLTRAALNEIVNRIESESGKTLEDKDSFVEEMVALSCGYATPYTVDYLTEASPEYRSAYEEYFGQTLPKDNEQMREFVYKQSATNLVESAKAETIDKIDTDKGFYDVQVANHLGEEGQQTLQAISDNIGVLDSMSYIQQSNQLVGAYEEGRNGASLDKVLELYSGIRGLDRASVEAMYQAGVADKARGSNTGSVVYDVTDRSKIRNSHRDTMLAFSRIFGVNIVVTDKLTVEKANKIENKQSVEESGDVGAQINGMFYDNTIYINLNDDIRKPIGYTIMHELTHGIKQMFPEDYDTFAELFKEGWIAKNGEESFSKAIQGKIKTYADNNVSLSEADALEEIICDQMAEVLYDEQFMQNIAENHPSLAQSLLYAIQDVIRKIRQLFANYGGFRSEFNEATLSQLDMLKDAEALLVKAIQAAQDGRTQEILSEGRKYSFEDTALDWILDDYYEIAEDSASVPVVNTAQVIDIRSKEDLIDITENDIRELRRNDDYETLGEICEILYTEKEIEAFKKEAEEDYEELNWIDLSDIEERFAEFKEFDEPAIRRVLNRPESQSYENNGKQVSFTSERIERLIRAYSYGGNKSSAYVTRIHPRDFLKLTLPDNALNEWNDNVGGKVWGTDINALDIEKLKNEKQTPYLTVDMDNRFVTGHEGRHRMRALLEAGFTSVPIVVECIDSNGYSMKGEKDAVDNLEISSQSFSSYDGPVNDNYTTTISNLIPLNEMNKQNIEEAYGNTRTDLRFSIEENMSPGERYDELKDKAISVIESYKSNLPLNNEEIAALKDKKISVAKKEAVRLAKALGVKGLYLNDDIDFEFEFSNAGIKESGQKQQDSKDEEKNINFINLMANLDFVIGNAHLIEKHDEDFYVNNYDSKHKKNPNIKNTYVLISAFADEDNIVPVKLTVMEYKSKNSPTMHVAITVNTIKKSGIITRSAKNSLEMATPIYTIKLSQLLGLVNDERLSKYIPQQFRDDISKSSIDAQGNNLSPQQSEYFKDSKVRDEDDNLLVMYHGTKADFTVFDKNYIGGTGRFEGAGFNFTSFEGRAMSYDTSGEGKVFRTYLNIKNPLSDSERTITKSKLKKIVSGIAQREDIEGYDSIIFAVTAPYGKNIDEDYNRSLADTVDYLWRSCKTDADIYSQISTLGTNDEVVIDEFEKEGFDGLIWHDDGTISTVIAFEPEQIKSVDNKQPTLNPDIRFSIQQSEYIAENMNVGIQFSLPTFHNEMPKFEKWTKTKGFTGIGEVISGKELLIRTMVKNKIDEDVAKRIVGFLATVANGITSDVMHATYAYINWENLENSEVSVRIDRDGNITSIVGSAMVANGEYPVNFDFTTICNKREGMMEIIKKLALTQTESGTSYLDEIKLTRENIWKMNLALKEHNVDTACLGCFVEARRYNTDSFLSKIDEKWNSAVREKRKELGLPEEEYFDFSTNAKPSNEDVSQAIELWEGYDSNKTRGAKSSPAARINTLLKNATADSPYLKLIHPSDMLTPAGIEGLSHISVEGHSLVKTMKSIYGTAAPKEILAFTPYNSEIALLPEKVGNKDIIEYLKEIGGVRVQSFSDFKIENVFDYMQMVADMAARKFPAHAYTKVIEFAEIFGLTGIKINLSVMFDVHSSNEWAEMLGCDSKRAKEIAKKYAGLTFVEKIPEDDKKRLKDEKQTRPYKFVTDFEGTGKNGYITYLVGDKDRAEKAYQATKDAIMSGQKYRDGLLTDDEVEMMARSAMPFDQSINYNEAAEKQGQEGYKEHIGIIAVGYSDEHIRMLLDDNNVRYIIPYHKSGLPTEISKVSNLGNARSYEDLQNTIRVKDGKIYDSEGKAKNLKKHYENFAKEHEGDTPAIDYITSMINSGDYTITTKEKKLDENGEVKETKADVKLHGTGTFDVYKSLAKHSEEGFSGVQAVAEEYCDHCLRDGCLPIFYQFVDNPSYFKFLFDYAVTDADGNIHMQGAVKNAYPGINADEVAQNREIEESDLKELYASVRKGMAMQNEKNRNFAENKDSIIQGLTTKGTAHSIVEGTNLAPIINGTPDYLHPKYAPEINLETEKSDDTRDSLPGAKFSISAEESLLPLGEVIPSKESVIQYSIDNPWDTSWFDGMLDDEEVNTRGDKNKSIAEISAEFTNIIRDNAKLTGGKILDRKSIKKQIGELVKMTTKDTTYTATEKREIANFLMDTAEQIWSIVGEKRPIKLKQEEIDRIINLLYDASDYVISNAKYINDTMLDEIIEFKKFFRGREVGVSAGARDELADDWDTIRKRNFGRVRFVSAEKYGVTNIADALIQTFPEAPEISLLYGREVEEALEIGDEATLVRILDDVLSNLSVVDDAIKSEYAEDFRVALSQDFARIVLNEGEAWESKMDRFKDRYEQRIKDLRARQKEAVRDLRSNYEKLLAEQNATFKKKLAETKAKSEAKLQAEKDKQKAKEQKRKDSEQRKKIKSRIAEDYNWLAQRLVKPKKDDFKHIPSDFVESVANLLEIFDFQTERSLQLEEKRGHASGATKAMRELKDKISKYSSPDGGNVFVRNDALDALVDECIGFLDGRALRELEDNELQKVSDILRAVRHMVKTQNELFVANRKATVTEAGESIISESAKKMEKYGRRYDRTGISGKLSHLLNETMMTPGNFFDSLGGTMKALYKNLRNAQDDYIMKVKFLRDFYKDLLGGYYKKAKPGSAVEDWQTQTNEFTLSDGSKLNITVAQVMSLYCLSKREQALRHIVAEAGGSGIVLSDVTIDRGVAKVIGGKIQNTASGYRMKYNDVMNVISSLTDEQKRIADAIQNLMNTTLKEWGNETSLRLFDMEFFTEENYFPISVEQSELATEIGKGTEIKGSRITSFGMTKPLTEHANNKIIIGDIFSIAADHCNKMALYSAYAPSLIDFNRVYNYKQRNEDGTTGYTVKGILKDAYSNKALKFIDNILDDINGQAKPRTDGLTAMINTSLANYKKAAIGLNIRVLVQQPTAIMRSLYMINPKYFTPDCFVGLKSAREEMHKYCPISAWKAWGNYQNDYTKNFEDVMLNKDWSKFDAVTMGAYGWADDMTWAVIWNAVKKEVKQKNPNVEVGSEEYWNLCNERASEVYDETQVVDSVFHRSDAMRNPDKLSKVATSFMAEPTRTYNMIRSSIVKAYRSHKDGDNKAAASELNKMLVVVMLNAAAVSAAAAVVDAFRGKGDDDDDETWLETFYRNFGENFKDNVNMLHNIVFVKDVASLFENAMDGKYFSPSNMVFDGWTKLAKGVGEYKKVLSGDKSFIEWISGDFGAGIGYVTGIPTATFIKDTKALWSRLSLPTFASDGVEEDTPSLWDYENNPLEITDGTWADNVLNFFGINLTPEERAERDFNRTLESVKNKTKNLSGAEKKEEVNKIVMEGYTSLVEDGDFAKLKQMRRIIEAAGGDVEAFDEKVTKRTASEYKKTIGVEADMAKQAEMRQYLLENGWTEAKISGEIVYKSNLAKDFKKACRELDIEKGTDVLTYLILAGITEADAYKLWENRNRGNFDTYSTGKYIAPTNGQITSGFGYRSSPTAGASSYHQGIDIAASRGSVVSAADGGRVVYAGYNGGYGNQIVIQHDDGTQTYYSHLDYISVRKGQSVSQKQYIGNVGSTGISTGPHLDFRVNVGGQFVDPLKYFSV